MTTEEDFQATLDEHPDAHQVRMMFADWLQDRDDPRADGYRAMGVLRKFPHHILCEGPFSVEVKRRACPFWSHSEGSWRSLPHDWFDLLVLRGKHKHVAPYWDYASDVTRREAEDAAALAFSRLPLDRQQELLSTEVARESV